MNTTLRPWASKGFFQEGTTSGFPGVANNFSRGAKDCEISFFPLETQKTSFLLKI